MFSFLSSRNSNWHCHIIHARDISRNKGCNSGIFWLAWRRRVSHYRLLILNFLGFMQYFQCFWQSMVPFSFAKINIYILRFCRIHGNSTAGQIRHALIGQVKPHNYFYTTNFFENSGNQYHSRLVSYILLGLLTAFHKGQVLSKYGIIKPWTKNTKKQKIFIIPSWGAGASPWPSWSWSQWPQQEKRTQQLFVWQYWTLATGISLLCNWHKWRYWTGTLLVSGSPHYRWGFSDSSELCGSRSLPPGRAGQMQTLFSTESHSRVCTVDGSHNMRCIHQRSSNTSSCGIHWR